MSIARGTALDSGERDADAHAAARGPVVDGDGRIVALRDLAHDREPEAAAAAPVVAVHAVEALEDALALGPRNARPIVDHFEHRARTLAARAHQHVLGAITRGVVDEV